MKKRLMATALFCMVLLAGAPALACHVTDIVDINIDGLQSFDLAAFDLNVNYDGSALEFQTYFLTDGLGSITLGDADDWSFGDDGFGTVNLAVLSYLDDFSAQPDAFTLASLVFYGEDNATSSIELSDIILSDEFGDPIPYTVSGTDISAVPVPGALWLLGSGLLGLLGLRRHRKR